MTKTILAVLDDLFFTSKIMGAFREPGVVVKVLPDPQAALEFARISKPVAAIVDLGILRGDPIELIKTLKKEFSLPVLAYTNHTNLEGQQRAREAGCDLVVPKSQFSEDLAGLVGYLTKI